MRGQNKNLLYEKTPKREVSNSKEILAEFKPISKEKVVIKPFNEKYHLLTWKENEEIVEECLITLKQYFLLQKEKDPYSFCNDLYENNDHFPLYGIYTDNFKKYFDKEDYSLSFFEDNPDKEMEDLGNFDVNNFDEKRLLFIDSQNRFWNPLHDRPLARAEQVFFAAKKIDNIKETLEKDSFVKKAEYSKVGNSQSSLILTIKLPQEVQDFVEKAVNQSPDCQVSFRNLSKSLPLLFKKNVLDNLPEDLQKEMEELKLKEHPLFTENFSSLMGT